MKSLPVKISSAFTGEAMPLNTVLSHLSEVWNWYFKLYLKCMKSKYVNINLLLPQDRTIILLDPWINL